MTVLSGYNVIKEGDIYNISGYVSTYDVVSLSPSELMSLYSGYTGEEFATLSGNAVSGSIMALEIRWGDTYDVDNIKYNISPTSVSGVSITYGINNGTETSATVYNDGSVVVASGIGDARYIRLIHSCSPNVVVGLYQVAVEGVRNETLGFGTAVGNEITTVLVNNSPIGYYSSTPISVPVWNDNDSAIDIKVATLPTGSDRDRNVFISTTYSGIYYGIDDYGFSVPAFERINLHNDSLIYSKFSQIDSQWKILEGTLQNRIYPTSEGLKIDYSIYYGGGVAHAANMMLFGLMSNSTFTGNQSFTIKIKVKLLRNTSTWSYPLEVLFGMSNNMPIPCASYNESFPYVDETSFQRAGRSGACVGVSCDENKYRFIYGDGDLEQYVVFSSYGVDEGWDSGGSFSSSDFGYALYGDTSSNDDWSDDADFREWIFTWDHLDREAVGYIGGVKIGSRRFSSPPLEGCRIFFVSYTYGSDSAEVLIKDFEINLDSVYKQKELYVYGGVSAVESSLSADSSFHGVDRLIDGTGTEWISKYNPTSTDFIDLTLDGSSDIIGFKLTNPDIVSGNVRITAVSGTSDKYLSYALKTVSVSVDGGSVSYYPVSFTSGKDSTYRFRDSSEMPTVYSGSESVKMYLTSLYGSSHTDSSWMNALAIRDISVISEYYESVSPAATSSSNSVPWSRGLSNNLMPAGSTGYLGIGRSDVYEVSLVGDAEQLVKGTDYDVSSSYYYGSLIDGLEYPFEQALFRDNRNESTLLATQYWCFVYTPSSPAWVWRRFKERNNIRAVYIKSYSGLNTSQPHTIINSFKVQYLDSGCDPSTESSWIDVPVISNRYTGTSAEYKTYRDYFISHNDGEWYTDTAYSFTNCAGMPTTAWYVPSDIVAKKDFRWSDSWTIEGSCSTHLTSVIYLEFDTPVLTDAIRLVIKDCLNEARTASTYIANITTFAVFRDGPSGSYVSPVFDTTTQLNTERVVASLCDRATSSGTVYVRASDIPPTYRNDYEYLTWQPWQTPLKDTIYDVEEGTGTTSDWTHFISYPKHGLVVGTKVYIMPTSKDYYPICYDYDTNAWSLLSEMGTSATNTRASTQITNHSVLLNDGCIYVAVESGDTNSSRMMRYDITADSYGISGWRHLGVNRPQEALHGGMVGYGGDIIFIGYEGDLISYDVSGGTWDSSLSPLPMHGMSYRYNFWPVIKDSKIYVVGGYGLYPYYPVSYIDIYDIVSDSWADSIPIPYYVGHSTYAHLYGDRIFILNAVGSAKSGVCAIFNTATSAFDSSAVMSLKTVGQNTPGFSAGTSWVYGDYLYSWCSSADGIENGFRKTKVKREPWVSGYSPALLDPGWEQFSSSSETWKNINSCGEIMPQRRYFQFRVQLDSDDSSSESCLLKKASVVIPQTIEDVPPRGTKDFYIKLGVSVEGSYEGWYGGASLFGISDYGWGTYYTSSSDGPTFGDSVGVFSPTDSGTYYLSKTNPSVIKNAVNNYCMWFIAGRYLYSYLDPYQTLSSGVVCRATSSNGASWGVGSEVVGIGSEGTYDTETITDCCVLNISPTVYRMWYTGVSLSDGFSRIIYTESTNGILWSNFLLGHDIGTPALPGQADIYGAYAPCVIYDSATGYYTMWYSGLNADYKASIIRCVSIDGRSWSSHNSVIDYGFHGVYDVKSAHYPFVIKDISTYRMWYVGVDAVEEPRVLYTYSEDGISWSSPVRAISRNFNGSDDAAIGRVCIVNNRTISIPNSYYNDAKIKIYNG